jgi:DNA-directed RNA polymerase specialized sigma24 family protein
MRDTIVRLTPRLRRYAHALLGSWPSACSWSADGRARPDQEADDLAHEALLGFWRAGRPSTGESCVASPICLHPESSRALALYRRVTALARQRLATDERASPTTPEASIEAPRHFAFAPEAHALPRLSMELRALLALVTIERLTYQEAGEVLDRTGDQVLARLSVARARYASEISGRARPHLRALAPALAADKRQWPGGPVTEADLHRFVDRLLDDERRGAVAALLAIEPEMARRTAEWRRHSERLRLAFDPLLREPLPLSLDFSAPNQVVRAGRREQGRARGFFVGLAASLATPAGASPQRL